MAVMQSTHKVVMISSTLPGVLLVFHIELPGQQGLTQSINDYYMYIHGATFFEKVNTYPQKKNLNPAGD